MPHDPTTLPNPHHARGPVGAFAQGAGLGVVIPLFSLGFAGIGGNAGYVVAVAILAVTAIAVKPSLSRAAGVATGIGIAFTAFLALVAFVAATFGDL